MLNDIIIIKRKSNIYSHTLTTCQKNTTKSYQPYRTTTIVTCFLLNVENYFHINNELSKLTSKLFIRRRVCWKTRVHIYLWIYEFLSRIASSVLKVNCYQWGSCVGGPSAFNSPFGHRSHSHSICLLDNQLSDLSITLSSLVLSWVYRLPFFKSLLWLGCGSNSQPSVLVASTLPLHY